MEVGPLSEATRTVTGSDAAADVAEVPAPPCEPPQPTSPSPRAVTSEAPRTRLLEIP